MDVKQFVERLCTYDESVFGTRWISFQHLIHSVFLQRYAVAQWAKSLGYHDDYQQLMELSTGWEKLFDDSLKLIRPRLPNESLFIILIL